MQNSPFSIFFSQKESLSIVEREKKIPSALFACARWAVARQHQCVSTSVTTSLQLLGSCNMYGTFGGHHNLAAEQKPFRDLDSRKEHEHAKSSWFQQIGRTRKEANIGLWSC